MMAQLDRVLEVYFRAVELNSQDRRRYLHSECPADPDSRAAVERLLGRNQIGDNALDPRGPPPASEAPKLTPEQRQRVEEVFYKAIDLPRKDREDFVLKACAGDPALLGEVQRLLAYHDSGDALLPISIPPIRNLTRGQSVAHFEIVDFISHGGMGEVYEAKDTKLGQHVALKTLLPELLEDRAMLRRFKQEIILSRKVAHRNVCHIYDFVEDRVDDRDLTCYTMELLGGETLSDHLASQKRLSVKGALPLVRQLTAGLTALHDADVIHRDFKPGNIFLCPHKGKTRVVITDFGLARTVDLASGTLSVASTGKHIRGTPLYMAPEQYSGDPDKLGRATDIYALGLVIYEMIVGERPFPALEPFENHAQKVKGEFVLPSERVPGLDLVWDRAIQCCLEVRPERRPQTASEVVDLLEGKVVPIEPPVHEKRDTKVAPSPSPWPRRLRRVALAATAAVALLWVGLRIINVDPVIAAVQEDLCGRFPGQPLFCVLPADRDIAFQSLAVEADNEADLAYGKGLSQFIGDSLYRLRANKSEFCFHIRGSKPRFGTPLTLSGRLRVVAGTVRIETELIRASDGQVLRRNALERATDDLYGTHEGLIRDFAELVGYGLDPEQLEPWLAERPRDASAFQDYLVGQGLLADQNYEEARERFRSALDGPRGGLAFTAAARGLGDVNRHLFARSGDARWAMEAERSYRQAAAAPSVDLYNAWGTLAQAEGDHEEAVRHYKDALELDPFDDWAYWQLVLSYEALGDQAAAKQVLRRAAELRPDCWRIRNFMAKRQLVSGDVRGGEESLLKVLQLAPRNAVGYNNLAFLYLTEGRYDEVVERAAQAIEKSNMPAFYVTLGLGYLFCDCIDDALVNFRYAVARIPEDFRAWQRLAEALLATGRPNEAKEAFQRTADLATAALAEQPDYWDATCAASRSAAVLGDRPAALERLARLENLSPAADATHLCAAAVYDALGDWTEALHSLQQGIELGGTVHSVDQTPLSEDFRKDPRYLRLVADYGLGRSNAASEAEHDTTSTAVCPQSTAAGLPFT